MATATLTTETCDVAILSRMIHPERGDLSVTAARSFLKINFEQRDIDRMNELARKGSEGNLTPAEKAEGAEYCRVSHLIGLLHLKAKMSLKSRGHSA
jgi:hypothetical protein